jgi:cytochrome c-type biogenesis protein CcmH/NrfG
MSRESLAFAVSGVCFGLLVGWIIGSQQGGVTPSVSPKTQVLPAAGGTTQTPAHSFDANRAMELERQAGAEPRNAQVRTDLGNLYFDAERYEQAITWYEASSKLDGRDVNVSTDLAVAYYYSNQIDRALAQIDRSLRLDPRHLKTLLNQGIIRAFGKSDLEGARKSWEQVVALAPASDEGRRAQQGLDGLRTAHGAEAGSPGIAAP